MTSIICALAVLVVLLLWHYLRYEGFPQPWRWRYAWHVRRRCPHPPHRVFHIHGEGRVLDRAVAWCDECGKNFRHWPGGSHDSTPCH